MKCVRQAFEVDAIQYTGENFNEVKELCDKLHIPTCVEDRGCVNKIAISSTQMKYVGFLYPGEYLIIDFDKTISIITEKQFTLTYYIPGKGNVYEDVEFEEDKEYELAENLAKKHYTLFRNIILEQTRKKYSSWERLSEYERVIFTQCFEVILKDLRDVFENQDSE